MKKQLISGGGPSLQGFWGRRVTFPFLELSLVAEKMCRPPLALVGGGWRGPCAPDVLIRPGTPCQGVLGRDSRAFLVRRVGPLANSWTFSFRVRTQLCLSFPHLQNGARYFSLLTFLGTPSLSFLCPRGRKWELGAP